MLYDSHSQIIIPLKYEWIWLNFNIVWQNLIFFVKFLNDFEKVILKHFEKMYFWFFLGTKLEKCWTANLLKINEFSYIFDQFCSDFYFYFFGDKNLKNVTFSTKLWFHHTQNFVNDLWNLRDEHHKFCHRLVDQTFVTHSQTSPSERSHPSDTDSWNNHFQIRLIDLQNVETKSVPKFSRATN